MWLLENVINNIIFLLDSAGLEDEGQVFAYNYIVYNLFNFVNVIIIKNTIWSVLQQLHVLTGLILTIILLSII